MAQQQDGELIEHIGHDECGSSDAMAVYEKEDGSHDGYCWSCGEWVPDPYGEKDGKPKGKRFGMGTMKTPQQKADEVLAIYNTMPVLALTDRDIRQDTTAYFDVRVGVSPSDGVTPAEHYYPLYKDGVLVGYKVRKVLDKNFYAITTDKDSELFGQYQAALTGGKKLYVTEGECDAMALFQVLRDLNKGTEYEQYMPAVVSIVRGAQKAGKDGSVDATKVINEIAAQRDFLSKFEEIILVFDQDEAGKVSANAIAKLWPDRVKIATLSMKDPNAMMSAGKLKELKKAVMWNASSYKPSGIVTVQDVYEQARTQTPYGISWPWPTLTKLTYGIRPGEMIGLGAGTGVGKTQAWHTLEQHLIEEHGAKIGVFMLEETPSKTLKMLAGKFAGKKFHDPNIKYKQEELDAALKTLENKIILYDHAEDMSWETVRSTIRHMVLVEGCKYIILDPISSMTAHLDSSQANDLLNTMFVELAAMVSTLNFTLFYSSHLNAPSTGSVHEEGGRVRAAQFTGSRAMIKFSHLILGLERDTQAEDINERNTAIMRILKDRNNGNTGFFPIKYEAATGDFIEPEQPAVTTGVTY